MEAKIKVLIVSIALFEIMYNVDGHGRLWDPPGRSTLWRFPEFQAMPGVERNYNDHELFCGGFGVQYHQNGGNCGVCGDPWHLPQPRENEEGGKYGKGIIVRNYTQGQTLEITIDLTVSHLGDFTFRLCPKDDPDSIVEQSCLDQHLLEMADGSGTKFPILPGQTTPNFFKPVVVLPQGLTCNHCVLQWNYRAGNNWGICEDGTGALGCGDQETFRGCADVSIY